MFIYWLPRYINVDICIYIYSKAASLPRAGGAQRVG